MQENMNPTGCMIKDYTVLAELPVRSGSRLFLGRDAHGQKVHLKLFQIDTGTNLSKEEQLQRFRRECEIHLFLKHPRIIPALDCVEIDGYPCLVTEYKPFPNLKSLLQEERELSLLETLILIQQLCQALHYMHDQGVIHRDIKPENILVSEENKIYLMDFGCARQVFAPSITQTRTLQGSLAYMSPEQIIGKDDLDYRSDLFSTGVVFYQLLAGHLPFEGDQLNEIVQNLLNYSPAPIRSSNPWVPPCLEELVLLSLQKDRDYRIPTARKLAQEIEKLLENADIYYAEGCLRLEKYHQADAGREYCLLALQKNGYHLPSLKMLGSIYQKQAQWARARRCYERILEIQNNDPSVHFALCQIEKAEGFLDAAFSLVEQAHKLDPNNLLYPFEMGCLLLLLDRRYEALAQFQSLIQIDPTWEPPLTETGNIYYLEGHKEAALEHYRKAYELQPQAFETGYHLASIFHELGYYMEAYSLYQELAKNYPDSFETQHNLANLCYHLGELSQAEMLLESLLNKINWEHRCEWEISYRLLGFVYARLNRQDQAIEAYKHAILCKSDQLDAYLYLAFAYRESLRLDEAIKTLQYIANLPVGSNEAVVYFLMARGYYEQGKEYEAYQALEQCLTCTHSLTAGMELQVQQDLLFLKGRLASQHKKTRQKQHANSHESDPHSQKTILLFAKPSSKRKSAV
jgi:tetratricopeptide (TPR) repeat protein